MPKLGYSKVDFVALNTLYGKSKKEWKRLKKRRDINPIKQALSKQQRLTKRYEKWRKAILKKANYTCQGCKKTNVVLHAHHIKEWFDYPQLRFKISNGRALCIDCHTSIHPWMKKRANGR